MIVVTRDILARIIPKIRDGGECRIWTGATNTAGYPQIHAGGKTVYVGRYLWESANEKSLTKDVFLCHHCDNPRCVNLRHVYAGDAASNSRDMHSRNRQNYPVPARNRAKTHCVNGHEFNEANTLYGATGSRSCRVCCREKMRRRRAIGTTS